MTDQYQDAIYRRFKASFPDYRVEIAWNDMKQAWIVDVIKFVGNRSITITALVAYDRQLFTNEPGPYSKALARMPDWKPELTELGKRNVDDLAHYVFEAIRAEHNHD